MPRISAPRPGSWVKLRARAGSDKFGAWGELRGWHHLGWTASSTGLWHVVCVRTELGSRTRTACAVSCYASKGGGNGHVFLEPQGTNPNLCQRCLTWKINRPTLKAPR